MNTPLHLFLLVQGDCDWWDSWCVILDEIIKMNTICNTVNTVTEKNPNKLLIENDNNNLLQLVENESLLTVKTGC